MIPKKYETIVFAFVMSSLMSFIMSGVITIINIGIPPNFIQLWLKAYGSAFMIAFPTVLFVVPVVRKIVAKLITPE